MRFPRLRGPHPGAFLGPRVSRPAAGGGLSFTLGWGLLAGAAAGALVAGPFGGILGGAIGEFVGREVFGFKTGVGR